MRFAGLFAIVLTAAALLYAAVRDAEHCSESPTGEHEDITFSEASAHGWMWKRRCLGCNRVTRGWLIPIRKAATR